MFAGFDARNSPGSVRRAVSSLTDCIGSRRHTSNGWRGYPLAHVWFPSQMCDARALVHADRSPNECRVPLRGEPGDGPLVVEGAHPLRPEEAHARERDRPLVAEADQAASAHREPAVRRRCVHARSWRCWVGPGLLELALLELALLALEGQQMELLTLSWPCWSWRRRLARMVERAHALAVPTPARRVGGVL